MRFLCAFVALIALMTAVPAAASELCFSGPEQALPLAPVSANPPLVPIESGPDSVPAPLSPLDSDSPWMARFASAADSLFAALQSGRIDRWQPLLGGQWLGEVDRRAVEALIDDQCGAFAPILSARTPVVRRIFGWRTPPSYGAGDIAEIAARPEAEALVCWSARPDVIWPVTARDADNRAGRPYACARISYSVRGAVPVWRGFIEQS